MEPVVWAYGAYGEPERPRSVCWHVTSPLDLMERVMRSTYCRRIHTLMVRQWDMVALELHDRAEVKVATPGDPDSIEAACAELFSRVSD